MSKCICTLEPKAIWENFYKLTQVPRPSNHEEIAREFVMNWAKENGIHAEMDEAFNILLSKPATPGMENRKGVILQGHLDMVPQKNEDKQHDFTKDPIEAYIDGEWVTADGTTLGADNRHSSRPDRGINHRNGRNRDGRSQRYSPQLVERGYPVEPGL